MFEEEKTEVIGSFCTLLEDFGGVSDGKRPFVRLDRKLRRH